VFVDDEEESHSPRVLGRDPPCLEEQLKRLEAALGIVWPQTAAETALTPKSTCSRSQVDSGFGSPPFYAMNEDDDSGDDVGDVEPFTCTDFHEILAPYDHDYPARISTPDGKSSAA